MRRSRARLCDRPGSPAQECSLACARPAGSRNPASRSAPAPRARGTGPAAGGAGRRGASGGRPAAVRLGSVGERASERPAAGASGCLLPHPKRPKSRPLPSLQAHLQRTTQGAVGDDGAQRRRSHARLPQPLDVTLGCARGLAGPLSQSCPTAALGRRRRVVVVAQEPWVDGGGRQVLLAALTHGCTRRE